MPPIRYLGLLVCIVSTPAVTVAQHNDPEAAIRRAAKESEVHGVGVYEPVSRWIAPLDVTDWVELVKSLRQAQDPSGRVRDFLPAEVRAAIADEKVLDLLATKPRTTAASVLTVRLGAGLKDLLRDPMLYDEATFKDLPLGTDEKALIAKGAKRTPLDNIRLNRAILSATFPKAITKVPTDYHTARVRVAAGAGVILVLSAYEDCGWEVEVEKGGSVRGVVLCGSHFQAVKGVDAPVLYRAALLPDGNRNDAIFRAVYDRHARAFETLAAQIKDVTGREFASFQGQYTAGKEPFVVRPGAK